MRRKSIAILSVLLCCSGTIARAHFLFSRICPPAEGGRFAEVYFSEYARAGDPRYIAKVAPAQFAVQTERGKWKPLEMHVLDDRLRAHLPTTGSLLVAGQLDYGVLERPGTPPFLLRHYSKTASGAPQELNTLSPRGTPLELVAVFNDKGIELTALLDGQPLADTRIDIVDGDLSGEELMTDSQGKATFTPAAPSLYCVYVGHTLPTSGEHAGKPYSQVKQFATLSFEWPLIAQPDPEAIALFEEAVQARAAWKDFPGFSAEIEGELDGRPYSGTAVVAADGSVEIDLGEDSAMADWIDDQLESITMHRAAANHSTGGDKKPAVRFADSQTDHPLGRLLAFDGGHFASSYRVKDRQLLSVNRLLAGDNVTISVLMNDRNAEGKFLPRAYTVQAWNESTKELIRTETVLNNWVRVDAWDLPSEHQVTTATDDGFEVRRIGLTKHTITKPK